jgi:hypothetical protein
MKRSILTTRETSFTGSGKWSSLSFELAVGDYRRDQNITEPLVEIDGLGVLWWKKSIV